MVAINDLEETEAIKPLDVEVKALKQKSKDPEFLNNIIDSYAPSIYGHENIKLTCLLYLASGVPGQKRSEINVA